MKFTEELLLFCVLSLCLCLVVVVGVACCGITRSSDHSLLWMGKKKMQGLRKPPDSWMQLIPSILTQPSSSSSGTIHFWFLHLLYLPASHLLNLIKLSGWWSQVIVQVDTAVWSVYLSRGKVRYLRCQLPEALEVYKEAARLSRDQREIEHIVLYEQGTSGSRCMWPKMSSYFYFL